MRPLLPAAVWLWLSACGPVAGAVTVGSYTLQPKSSLVGEVGDGLRLIEADVGDVCGPFTAQACTRADVSLGQGDLADGIFLEVVLPERTLRRYSTDEASVRFLAAHGSQPQFVSTPRSGSVTLVSYDATGAVANYSLKFDTGQSLSGTLLGAPCPEIALSQPFGGVVCTTTSIDNQSRQDCACNGETSSHQCTVTPVFSGPFQEGNVIDCDCVDAAGTASTCHREDGKVSVDFDCCPAFSFPVP